MDSNNKKPKTGNKNQDDDLSFGVSGAAVALTSASAAALAAAYRWEYRHLTPYRRDPSKDKYRSAEDIQERLSDQGLDYWQDVVYCIYGKIDDTFGPTQSKITLSIFLDQSARLSIAHYKRIEKMVDKCIDEINRKINRDIGVAHPDDLGAGSLRERLNDAGIEIWREERKRRSPSLYNWKRRRSSPDDGGDGANYHNHRNSLMMDFVNGKANDNNAERWFSSKVVVDNVGKKVFLPLAGAIGKIWQGSEAVPLLRGISPVRIPAPL